jgi:hypothetical protein
MYKYILLFILSLLFGFSVLILRNVYEKNTSEIKSHWNVTQLEEGDSKNYFDRGFALSMGRSYDYGFENIPIVAYFRTPVYSIFLALIFLAFGVSLKAVIIIQIIMASMIVCLISMITKLIFDNVISWISGILAILYYPMWNDTMILNCEIIAMLFGLLSLFYILKFYYSGGIVLKYLLLSGLFVGFSSLSRGQFFYYSFLFLIFVFSIPLVSRKRKVTLSLYWFGIVLIPILFWTIYAYITSGIFIFISSQGAMAVWWGWSPAVVHQHKYPVWNSMWDSDKDVVKEDLHTVYLPVKTSFWFLKEAVKFIFEYPIDAIKIGHFKLMDSWGLMAFYSEKSIIIKLFKAIKFNWNFLLTVPAWVLLWKGKEKKVFNLYTILACVIYLLISLMTAGLIRYRIPFLDPLFIILASYTVYRIYNKIRFIKFKS